MEKFKEALIALPDPLGNWIGNVYMVSLLVVFVMAMVEIYIQGRKEGKRGRKIFDSEEVVYSFFLSMVFPIIIIVFVIGIRLFVLGGDYFDNDSILINHVTEDGVYVESYGSFSGDKDVGDFVLINDGDGKVSGKVTEVLEGCKVSRYMYMSNGDMILCEEEGEVDKNE